jgi:uncharacterized protein (DUF1015 family)
VQTLQCDPRPIAGPGLELAPFHGVRYAPGKVSGIANVTSPPYDVIGTGIREHLLLADPHNVVRLILPRADAAAEAGAGATAEPGGVSGADPNARAAQRLTRWLDEGVLIRDPGPAIYVYEQRAHAPVPWIQRGLIALVRVDEPDVAGILPHENVMPGPVAGRRDLMAATQANLEPIFLLYGDDGVSVASVTEYVDRVADEREPLVSAETDDGATHRLWRLSDPAEMTLITSRLYGRSALIADGHHRYAAYLQLRDQMRRAGRGAGPWDYGLAFLVDSAAYPPRVGAVHRVVPSLSQHRAAELAAQAFSVTELAAGLDGALDALAAAGKDETAFVLAGTDGFLLLSGPDPVQLSAAMPGDMSRQWQSLDAAVLQQLLIGRLWGITDSEQDVLVFHDARDAVRAVTTEGTGTGVITNPPSFSAVREIAGHGEKVPRKSTSFAPKPRTGLVMRTFG